MYPTALPHEWQYKLCDVTDAAGIAIPESFPNSGIEIVYTGFNPGIEQQPELLLEFVVGRFVLNIIYIWSN